MAVRWRVEENPPYALSQQLQCLTYGVQSTDAQLTAIERTVTVAILIGIVDVRSRGKPYGQGHGRVYNWRDGGHVPVICPTCQNVFRGPASTPAPPFFSRGCFLCMGLFSIFLLWRAPGRPFGRPDHPARRSALSAAASSTARSDRGRAPATAAASALRPACVRLAARWSRGRWERRDARWRRASGPARR